MIVVVDYGMGNHGSIINMLKKVGAHGIVSSQPEAIERAEKIILPGVGAFDNGMINLEKCGLVKPLIKTVVEKGTPILGLCLGMQLFTHRSDEGVLQGLGLVEAETVRFKFDREQTGLKIPHMGWNTIRACREHAILRGMQDEPRFYFVHSYHLKCSNPDLELASTYHGYEFTSIVTKGNIIGTQFHPEKSHKFGMQLLKNFVELI